MEQWFNGMVQWEELSVLERQRIHLKQQQQQHFQQKSATSNSDAPLPVFNGGESVMDSMQCYDPVISLADGWPDFATISYPDVNCVAGNLGCDSKKKRKSESSDDTQEQHSGSTKRKEVDASIGDQDPGKSNGKKKKTSESAKESGSTSSAPKLDYIHVRARRGQATDSHSLAERVRREKISERMKYLQELVPGCGKIVGKAGMLDEIINYVQSLQRQVEFLSMKLAAVNLELDYDMAMNTPSSVRQGLVGFGLDMLMDSNCMGLNGPAPAPMLMPTASALSCIDDQNSVHIMGLQNLYGINFLQEIRGSINCPMQYSQGASLPSNLKMEM